MHENVLTKLNECILTWSKRLVMVNKMSVDMVGNNTVKHG